jgi:chaperone modulatory protein CbpM
MEHRRIEETSQTCGVPSEIILKFIQEEWIIPKDSSSPGFDDEDIARIRLIWELHSEFGVNDESMSIILHLLDQLNRIHLELEKFRTH